jgi:hypothetical protein
MIKTISFKKKRERLRIIWNTSRENKGDSTC